MSTNPVVLADVVDSRSIQEFRTLRDRRLAELSHRHREHGVTLASYAVTSWDEFQNVCAAPRDLPRMIWDLRCAFRPHSLWIAVGFGEIDWRPQENEPLNLSATGEAFEHARRAMAILEQEGSAKYTRLTAFSGSDPLIVDLLDITYRLHDTLIQKITERQWETILAQQQTGHREETAARLGIDESTVSRNLKRAYWWQIQDTLELLPKALDCLHQNVQ
jgi:hypothetical protein